MFENLTKINPKIIINQISRRAFTDLSFLKLFADELTLFRTGVSNSWASGDHIAHISNCAEGREFDTPVVYNITFDPDFAALCGALRHFRT